MARSESSRWAWSTMRVFVGCFLCRGAVGENTLLLYGVCASVSPHV
jgi:hypothetical protein